MPLLIRDERLILLGLRPEGGEQKAQGMSWYRESDLPVCRIARKETGAEKRGHEIGRGTISQPGHCFEVGAAKALFTSPVRIFVAESNGFGYSVAANGQRFLVCSLCSHEWAFSEKHCPGCHAEKIEVLRHRSYPHLKAEACTACGHFLKTVDLRKDAAAVPLVDEIASTELDKQARERGFVKLEVNVAGM